MLFEIKILRVENYCLPEMSYRDRRAIAKIFNSTLYGRMVEKIKKVLMWLPWTYSENKKHCNFVHIAMITMRSSCYYTKTRRPHSFGIIFFVGCQFNVSDSSWIVLTLEFRTVTIQVKDAEPTKYFFNFFIFYISQ